MVKTMEYNKALNVLQNYCIQLQVKRQNIIKQNIEKYKDHFGFLWIDENNKEHCRWIKAENIDIACDKFYHKIPKTISRLDYEVFQKEDLYFDISNNEKLSYLI